MAGIGLFPNKARDHTAGARVGRHWTLGALAFGAAALSLAAPAPAWALSEIQREELPAPTVGGNPAGQSAPAETLPIPDGVPSTPAQPMPAEEPTPEDVPAPGVGAAEPEASPLAEEGPLPEVSYDLSKLPEPVRRMHGLLVEAAKSGDVERLRTLISGGEEPTQLSLGVVEGDVVEFLRSSSGDGEGYELLAILEEVLSAGYAHLNAGKPDEVYVWPYFFAVPLERLDAKQKVELFKIVTSGDYEEMKSFGAYNFYRAGIDPEGRWAFFVAGD